MEPSLTVIVLVSAGILGFGIKYFFHACDNDMSEQLIFIQTTETPEIPGLYEFPTIRIFISLIFFNEIYASVPI